MDKKAIGEKIRRERNFLGLSLEKFAGLIGTSKATLQRIETGLKSPSVALLYEISQTCRKPIEEFLNDERPDLYWLKDDKQKKIEGDDYKISIIAPYGLISRNMVINHYVGQKGAGRTPTQEKGYHWVYVLKGSCIFHYDDTTYELKKGDVVYYDSSKTFSFKVLKDFESIRIAIRP